MEVRVENTESDLEAECVFFFFVCRIMSSDVGWHIRDKLKPVCEHGSILLYIHWNRKAC